MCLHLGPAQVHRFVIIWRRNERLLRDHVSQTCSHPNDDKLALSPPLASQSSPDLDVMHVLLLRTEVCGHRTQLSFNGGGSDLTVLNHHTVNFFFSNKRKKGIITIDPLQEVFDCTETVWWTKSLYLFWISVQRGVDSRVTWCQPTVHIWIEGIWIEAEAIWWNTSAPVEVRWGSFTFPFSSRS